MGLMDWFKRGKSDEPILTSDAAALTGQATGPLPSAETMFSLNFSATQIMKDGEFAKYGFESQMDLIAAFTITEILDADSGSRSEKEIKEIIGPQFGLRPERIDLLIALAKQSRGTD